MAKVIANTKDMSRGDWLEIRNNYIGGSDASIVLGVNKWKTPFELWLEKTGQVDLNTDNENEAMYFGNLLEDLVAKEFERRTGKKVRRKNQMLQHEEHEFMMANIDRDIVGEKALLECKTTSAYNAKEWEGEEVPASYLIQINHYMAVTGYEKAYIACLIGGNTFVYKEVKRDDELIFLIIELERKFWDYHIKGKFTDGVPQAPALDGSSAAEKYIKERFNKAEKGLTIDLKAEHKNNIDQYLQLKETEKEIKTEITRLENLLKYDLGEAESGIIQRYQVNWKNVTSNRVDSKLLKSKYPEIAAEVTKESNSRRFEIKEAKE